MGLTSIDGQNPGGKKTQEFGVGTGLSGSKANHLTKSIDLLIAENCLVDKRIGAIVKRPGSRSINVGGTLGPPVALGEYIKGSATNTLGVNNSIFGIFGSTLYHKTNLEDIWTPVSNSAFVDYFPSRQYQTTQLGNKLFIAGGLPTVWKGPETIVDRVGIEASTVPMSFVINIGTGNITLKTGTTYVYTFYNTSNGLESDWSAIGASSSIGALTSRSILLLLAPQTQKNWNAIKIYRYLDGGAVPYLVDTVAWDGVSVLVYTDNKSDAVLTSRIYDKFERGLPPKKSYIVSAYSQCIWWVDAENPQKVIFSRPFLGDSNEMEYYPSDNFFITNEPITGLYTVPGKMLLFHARSISYISGTSVDDFSLQRFTSGVGTLFPNSISSDGERLLFLDERGFVQMPIQGGAKEYISREIDYALQPLLAGSYNSSLFVSTAYSPQLRQFILMVSAQSTAGAPWVQPDNITFEEWETVPGAVTDIWEDVNNPNTSDITRVKIWGYTPELSSGSDHIFSEYSFPGIEDKNTLFSYPTIIFTPKPFGGDANPQQDKTLIGISTPTTGGLRSIFQKDKNRDDNIIITAKCLTGRLEMGDNSNEGYKYLHGIGFKNSYSDPTSDGLCTLKYLIDFDDAHIRNYTGSLVAITDNSQDIKKFPTALCRHIHLYIEDTSESQDKILLSQFFITFREKFRHQGR